MKTNTNQMRNAECGMRNKYAAASAANSLRTPHSALRTPPAFTLIELLVVITIMSILAGFTLVVLSGVKKNHYIHTATAELGQIDTALGDYHSKYGVYPPSNQNLNSVYTSQNQDRSEFSQLYYELSGTMNNGTTNITLDSSSQIKVADVSTAYGVGGFINCSKGGGEDAPKAMNFLSGLSPRAIYYPVTNSGIPTTMLVTSVGGPDQNYKPLHAPDLNPFRYIYPGTNNPGSYDLWVQLSIGGKTYLICNWRSKQAQINSPLP